MHVSGSKILLCNTIHKFLRVILPLLIILFLLCSNNQAAALRFTDYYVEDGAEVKTSPINLAVGNSSSASIASTSDYASVTATAGLKFIENTDILIPTQAASPSLDGSNITQVTSATSGSCTFTTTSANDVIYVAISILGTTATSSVTNATGSPLTLRGAITNTAGVRCETWYKIATSTGAQNVTVYFTTETTFAIIAMGVKNANIPNPFDLTSGNPMLGTGVGSTQAVTVGSILANTLVIGSVAVMGSVTPTVGSGFTSVQRSDSGGLGEAVAYKSLTTIDNTTAIFLTGLTSVAWAMVGDVIWGKLPSLSVDTGFSEPVTGGNKLLPVGKEGYLVSPAYPRATTIYAGWWQLNVWGKSQFGDEGLDLMLLVTDSSYNIVSDVCSRKSTGVIPDSPSLVSLDCDQPQVNVPEGGHLVIIVSNLQGASNTFTLYWGTQGATNFKTNQISNYILCVVNSGSVTYDVSFSAYSTSSITKLTNLTMYVYPPNSNCIIVSNGVLIQSASSVQQLSGTSTLYLAINATATDFNSVSNIVVLVKYNNAKPFAYDCINLSVN